MSNQKINNMSNTKKTDHYFVIEATMEDGQKVLCFENKKHIYFAIKEKGFATPLPPTLFLTKKEALSAIHNVPQKGANLKQFNKVIKAKKIKVIKIQIQPV